MENKQLQEELYKLYESAQSDVSRMSLLLDELDNFDKTLNIYGVRLNKAQKQKYLDIYYECFDEVYENSSIPNDLIRLLNIFVENYEIKIRSGQSTNLFMTDDSKDDMRIEYIYKLVNLFTRIAADNKQDKVMDICKMFIQIGKGCTKMPDELFAYFYPQEAHLSDHYKYHMVMLDILSCYTYDNRGISRKYFKCLDKDLRTILDMLKEYRDNINTKNLDDVDYKYKFVGFMNVVVSYYYKDKYDVNLFPKVLDYVFNHISYLEEFRKLNDNGHALEDIIISKIMENCTGNIPVIK